ncbi:MAG: TlpA disulfide reductase family protein, partial [Planctomycetota bacterium]
MSAAIDSFVRRLAPLMVLLLGLPTVLAAEFNMDVTAAGIRPGDHVAGPVLSNDSLAHRVVLLEFWGVNCPPCIRSMPLLEELHKTLGPQGLVVIGAHAQGGTAEELKRKVAQLRVSFTILDGAQVEGGADFQGIPHCMLFDHTGKCVYRG